MTATATAPNAPKKRLPPHRIDKQISKALRKIEEAIAIVVSSGGVEAKLKRITGTDGYPTAKWSVATELETLMRRTERLRQSLVDLRIRTIEKAKKEETIHNPAYRRSVVAREAVKRRDEVRRTHAYHYSYIGERQWRDECPCGAVVEFDGKRATSNELARNVCGREVVR